MFPIRRDPKNLSIETETNPPTPTNNKEGRFLKQMQTHNHKIQMLNRSTISKTPTNISKPNIIGYDKASRGGVAYLGLAGEVLRRQRERTQKSKEKAA